MNIGPGNLYVISAPSGTGKTTLVKALIESTPGVTVSISHTTREKRPGETHGINYYFIDKSQFHSMIDQHEFLEYATVFNNFYGTSRRWVEQTLAQGQDVILEIDWQGSQQIYRLFPECIRIFILPPSLRALSERLLNRNQDRAEIIKERLADVRESTSYIHEFNYVVMNDDFDVALKELQTIIYAGRLLQKRQTQKFSSLLTELTTLASLPS
jgi:guanylate kinase